MSFVVKAVKKVFKVAKKIVKKTTKFLKRAWNNKWVRIAVIIAVSLFTAGVLGPMGFSAFTGVNSVGGFFSAVGTTIGSGFSTIVGGLANMGSKVVGMFGGAGAGAGGSTAAATAMQSGVVAGNAALGGTGASLLAAPTTSAGMGAAIAGAEGAGLMTAASQSAFLAAEASGLSLAGAGLSAGTQLVLGAGTSQAAGTGILSKIGGLLLDKGIGGTLTRAGIYGGIMQYYKNRQAEKEEGYWRQRTVWGGPAFGGTTESEYGPLLKPQMPGAVGGQANQQESYEQQLIGQQSVAAQQASLLSNPQAQQAQLFDPGFNTQPLVTGPEQSVPALASTGVPAQQTQPPPATQPQQPGLLQLETMGAR